MSNYPGFYYYQKPMSCSACIDTLDLMPENYFPDCKKCQEMNRKKVKLLKLSGGLFRHDAVIQHIDTGKLETVPIRYLTFGGNDDW